MRALRELIPGFFLIGMHLIYFATAALLMTGPANP